MTRRVRSALGRFLALGVGLAIALAITTSPLAAQQTTGKIEGTVADQAGVPIANAQVFVVGTSFGAVTNDKGYYFINNVPVGTYTVRAQFIGYAPAEVRGIRVIGGNTITVSVPMQSSAVVLTGVTVTAATNPIVPRDQVASKSSVGGDLVTSLPVDDVRNIIAIQPGVVESGASMGVSIRGGRPGEANVYIDGAPVRATNSGSQRVDLGTNAVEEASVTTGALGVEFADAQSGVIAFTTKAGGPTYAGTASWESDSPFGDAISVGYNRFELSVGGPIPRVTNLTFFLSSVAEGQLSDFRGYGNDRVPMYVWGAADTTVQVPDANGNLAAVTVPQFIQYSGQCPEGSDASNPVRNAILTNYGVECQGRRFPMDWTTNIQVQGKLQYTYGQGSRVALSGIASGEQARNFPGAAIGDPVSFTGFHNWSRYWVLDANHTFIRGAERALSLNVNLSRQRDNVISGPLDPTYELDSRDLPLGLEFGSLKFAGLSGMPFPITDQIINNIRTNTGARLPLLNRGDLENRQPHRLNPYAMQAGGWRTEGMNVTATLYQETRYSGRAVVDFQANRFNRFKFGGDVVKTELAFWSSGLLRQFGMDAYIVDPVKYGLFATDRLDLGDVVLELGLRYDYYNSNALFANTPGRIYTNPAFNRPAAIANPDSLAASVARVFTEGVGHSALSPRLGVSFPVTENTNFRLSYSHQVQSPDFNTMMVGINSDLDFTNTNDQFGRDLQFGKTILFEFGVRHAFSPDMVLDISAYNKDKVSDFAARILPYADPFNPGDTVNLNVMTNADFGNVRGVDMRFDRRFGNYLSAGLTYTFQLSKGTGSDPLSYLRTTSRAISQVTGSRVPPPQAILPTDDNRTHNINGSFSLTLPSDWRQGTALGNVLRDVSVFATLRVVSGQPYTRQINEGSGTLAPRQAFGLIGTQAEPVNASNLPWIKNVNLRVTKGFKLGRTDLTLYADARNVLNFKNVTQLFVETSDVVNAEHRRELLAGEFAGMRTEANANGALLAGDALNLTACGSWTNPANCVSLQRAEMRFGDGDRTYSLAEQTRALNTYYDAFNGTQFLYGAPRHIRVGFEVNF